MWQWQLPRSSLGVPSSLWGQRILEEKGGRDGFLGGLLIGREGGGSQAIQRGRSGLIGRFRGDVRLLVPAARMLRMYVIKYEHYGSALCCY